MMNKKILYIYILMGDLHMAYQTDRPQRSFSFDITGRFRNSLHDLVTYGEFPWFILSCVVVIIGLIYGLYLLVKYLFKDSSPTTPPPEPPPKKTTTTDTTSPPKSDDDDKNK